MLFCLCLFRGASAAGVSELPPGAATSAGASVAATSGALNDGRTLIFLPEMTPAPRSMLCMVSEGLRADRDPVFDAVLVRGAALRARVVGAEFLNEFARLRRSGVFGDDNRYEGWLMRPTRCIRIFNICRRHSTTEYPKSSSRRGSTSAGSPLVDSGFGDQLAFRPELLHQRIRLKSMCRAYR